MSSNNAVNQNKAKHLIGKAINPSLFLSLIVSVSNAYVEFQDMQKVLDTQKTQLHDLEIENTRKTTELKELVDATRERFKDDEKLIWELRLAVVALQTEARTHGGSRPVMRQRSEALEQEMSQIVQRIDEAKPMEEPLQGIDF